MENRPDFTKLRIWELAHKLTLEVYRVTAKLPSEEKFGLTSQLRRAAVSVESLIAEGHGRYHYADAIKFLIDARGSAFEVQTQLLITSDLKYASKMEADVLITAYTDLIKQINALVSYKRKQKASLTKSNP